MFRYSVVVDWISGHGWIFTFLVQIAEMSFIAVKCLTSGMHEEINSYIWFYLLWYASMSILEAILLVSIFTIAYIDLWSSDVPPSSRSLSSLINSGIVCRWNLKWIKRIVCWRLTLTACSSPCCFSRRRNTRHSMSVRARMGSTSPPRNWKALT